MKNKILVKRVLAFALAATMVVGEASTVLASDLSIDGVAEETDQSLVGAYNGEVSDIIGLEGESTKNSGSDTYDRYGVLTDASGNKKQYYSVYDHDNMIGSDVVIANGDLSMSSAIALESGSGFYNNTIYKYGDKYYEEMNYFSQYGVTEFYNEIVICKTVAAASANPTSDLAGIYDSVTELYTYNGKNYHYCHSYTIKNDTNVNYYFVDDSRSLVYQIVDSATDSDDAKNKLKSTDGFNYYTIGGKYYTTVYGAWGTSDGRWVVAAITDSEIAFTDSYTSKVSWNALSSKEVNATADGKKIYVGYEVKCNDKTVIDYDNYSNLCIAKDAAGTVMILNSSPLVSVAPTLAGENYKVEVRGVYYTKTETKNAAGTTVTSYDVYKTGNWSTYNYTVADSTTEIGAPTNLKTTDNGTTVDVTFDAMNNAKVVVYEYSFKEALTDASTAAKVTAATSGKIEYTDYCVTSQEATYGDTKVSFAKANYWSGKFKYHYYIAKVYATRSGYTIAEDENGDTLCSNVAYAEYTGETGVSDLQNFRVEYNQSGGYTIKWDKEDSNKKVYIYRYTDATFPADYNYNAYDAYNKTNGITTTYFSTFDNNKQALVYNNSKLTKATASISAGQYSFNDTYSTEVGKTYYFVAMTVDIYNSNVAKTTPIKLGDVDYYYYNTVGNATAVISAARTLGTPSVEATVTKDSVKLTMSGAPTGYVIYKKNSKGKFKKLTTTTDNNYTDTGLKLNKTYTYRVYEYYYNDVTGNNDVAKKYTTVSATTCKTDKFEVKATMSSTKKVKVSWTKIKNATKYEVYRISNDDDMNVTGNKTAFGSTVKLVKTIKKASKTSFTDKVNAGQSYEYRVVATYKSDKKKVKVEDSAYITMKLEAPEITKVKWSGTTVKFTWDKNKFAEGYQVEYTTYDAAGNADTHQAKEEKTTSNSYSVTVSPYGRVAFSVKAYNGNVYSGYASYYDEDEEEYTNTVTAYNRDAAVSGVSATYNAETGAVDVAWNASASAAYYEVRVATEKPTYNETTKTYSYSYVRNIAKEANDDEDEDASTVAYEEVKGITDSITATTASDNSKLGLKKGVKYYYYVIGYNAAGQQVTYASAPASVTYAIAKPAIKSIKNKKSKKAVIKYSAVEAASGKTTYVIYRSTKKNGTYKKVGSTTKTSYTDKKLKKGKTYYYKVVATGKSALNSDFSVTSSAKKVKIKK